MGVLMGTTRVHHRGRMSGWRIGRMFAEYFSQNFRISWVGAGRGAKQPEHSSAREGNVRYARPSGASGCRDGVSAHSWHPPPRKDPVGIAHSPVAHTFRQPATSKFQFSTFPGKLNEISEFQNFRISWVGAGRGAKQPEHSSAREGNVRYARPSGPPDVGMAYRHIRGTLRPARIRLESLTRLSHTRFANPRRQNFSFPLFRKTEFRNFRISEFHGSEQGGARNSQSTRVREKEMFVTRVLRGPPDVGMAYRHIRGTLRPARIRLESLTRLSHTRFANPRRQNFSFPLFRKTERNFRISEFQNFMGRSREGRETARALECARRKCSLRASFGGLRMSGWRIGTFVAPSAPQGSGWNRSLACRTHVSPTRDVKISVFHFSGKLNETKFQNFRISEMGQSTRVREKEMFVTRVLRGPPDVGMAYRHICGTLRPARIRLESLTRLSHTRFANPRRQNFSFPLFRKTERTKFQNFRISWVGAGRGAKQPEHSSAREGNVRYARPSGASGCRDGVSAHSWHPPPRKDPVGIAHSPVAHTFRQPATSKFQFSTFPEFQNFKFPRVGAGGARNTRKCSLRASFGGLRMSGWRIGTFVAPSAPRGF